MGFLHTSLIAGLTAVAVVYLPAWFEGIQPLVLGGHNAPGWEGVQEVFRKNIEGGLKKGASFAVFYKGELVAHHHGGYADEAAAVPWADDTLSCLFSSTKFFGALMIGMLVDRGLLDYDAPVSQYWPEFAENGKQDVTLEQLMSHQAGLAYLDEKWTIHEPMMDPEGMGRKLASQKPHWKPGTKHGYHAFTIGLYIDQLVRRVDPKHRDVSRFFDEEIAKPFGLDVFLGLPLAENHRCARLVASGLGMLDYLAVPSFWPLLWQVLTKPGSVSAKMASSPPEYGIKGILNNPTFRTTTNPAAMGFGTATSLAQLMGAVANGGQMRDKKLISPETVERMSQPLISGVDESMRLNTTYGAGPMLLKSPLGSTLIGHPGAGGQMIFADPAHHLGWAYLTNYMFIGHLTGGPFYDALIDAVYEAYRKIDRNAGTSGGG